MGYTNLGINTTTTLNASTSLTSLTKDGMVGNLTRNNSVITDIYKKSLPVKSVNPKIDFSNPQKSHYRIHSLEKKEPKEHKIQTASTNTEFTSKQIECAERLGVDPTECDKNGTHKNKRDLKKVEKKEKLSKRDGETPLTPQMECAQRVGASLEECNINGVFINRSEVIRKEIEKVWGDTIDWETVTPDVMEGVNGLYLANKEIHNLNRGDFDDLELLQLVLDGNFLEEIPEDLFVGVRGLHQLILSNNRLSTLPENIFDPIFRETENPQNIFIRHVLLQNNNITHLPDKIFDPFRGRSSLSIVLYNNPITLSIHNFLSFVTTDKASNTRSYSNNLRKIHLYLWDNNIPEDERAIVKFKLSPYIDVPIQQIERFYETQTQNKTEIFKKIVQTEDEYLSKFVSGTATSINHVNIHELEAFTNITELALKPKVCTTKQTKRRKRSILKLESNEEEKVKKELEIQKRQTQETKLEDECENKLLTRTLYLGVAGLVAMLTTVTLGACIIGTLIINRKRRNKIFIDKKEKQKTMNFEERCYKNELYTIKKTKNYVNIRIDEEELLPQENKKTKQETPHSETYPKISPQNTNEHYEHLADKQKKDLFEANQTYDTLNLKQQDIKDTATKNEMKPAKTVLDDEKHLSSQELNRIRNIEEYPSPETIYAVIEPNNIK